MTLPSSPKAVEFHLEIMELSLSGTVLGFTGNTRMRKMSKTVREPSGRSVLWGHTDMSTAIMSSAPGVWRRELLAPRLREGFTEEASPELGLRGRGVLY